MLIFDSQTQGTGSGGSGCGCAASVLSAHFLPKLASGELKRILFVPTGALLSTVSFNEGQTIPGIAHGVVLESCVSSAKRRDKDMQYVIAFVTGGMICALSQILMEKQKCFRDVSWFFWSALGPSLDLWGSMSRFQMGAGGRECAASGIWKQSLEGGQRDGGQERIYRYFSGRF